MIRAHQIPKDLISVELGSVRCTTHAVIQLDHGGQGSRRVVGGLNDKRQITATLTVTLSGEFLLLQLLYTGKTSRCHPSYDFPGSFDIFHTPKSLGH